MRDYLKHLLRYGRIDPIEYYVSHDHGVVYVENAKVACTAIKQVLFPDHDLAALGQNAFHEAIRSEARFARPAEADEYLCFSFFRNPVERLLSCYRDKLRMDASAKGSTVLHRRFHRTLFRLAGGVDTRDQRTPFVDFARAVSRIPDALSDRHFASQSPLHSAVSASPSHFVGKLETLAEDWQVLAQKTGLPDLPVSNSSHSLAQEIDPEALQYIVRRYRADFSTLDYALPA